MSEANYDNRDGFKGKKPNEIKTMDIDDCIYTNETPIKPCRKDGVGDQQSVFYQWWKRYSGAAAVSLGLLCVLLLAGIIGLLLYQCPQGWKKLGSRCYYISTKKNTWERSRQDCRDRGADLVIINSQDKQTFVNWLCGVKKYVWIGLTDSVTEGTWKWVDDTPRTKRMEQWTA
ncbi:hypothetical protein J4Q44_G00037920 [Coregonus suidteri]|uniref:C-type lectin domain-containing protein n=1 Tax=Coregonus suidteri TaxID=861788 RepID=A0AAN8M418_9TELE